MSVSILKQNHQEGVDAQKRYKMLQNVQERYYFAMYKNATTYKNATLYKNKTQLEFEAINDEEYKLDGIPEADQHFFLIVQRYKLYHVRDIWDIWDVQNVRDVRDVQDVRDVRDVWECYENATQLDLYKSNKEYKLEGIWDSTVFVMKSEAGCQPEICLPKYLEVCIGSLTPGSKNSAFIPTSQQQLLFSHWACITDSPDPHWLGLDGSTYPSYNNDTSYASQYTAVCDAHGRVVVNDVQPVINNTTNLSEGLPVINDTTNLSEGLPVIKDMTNLSEGLPVINNTSIIMTWIKGCQLSMIWLDCVVNDLCGQWLVWLMTCMVNDLCSQ